jgi:hypothetical protein
VSRMRRLGWKARLGSGAAVAQAIGAYVRWSP